MVPDPARDARLEAVLVELLKAEDAGAIDPAAWYARYPEFRADLEQFLADATAVSEACDRAREVPAPAFPGYTVVRELGRGGNGVVFEAAEHPTGRVVALKALVGARLLTPVERVRFRREARVAALLDHPHILPVYATGEADGTPFYTMRLAPGGPLSRALDRFRADPTAAAALVARLARGVHFAHQRGILHRDLKPSNILLDEAGRGYVADFGLVRDLADPDPVTGTRELVGTIPYMAPESTAAREGWTVAVDVYGLGGVLYACLTGRPPFEGKSDADTLLKVRSDPPTPPAHLNPLVPRDLDAVCRKCLEKDPAARYPSAAALADDLDRFGRGEPVRAKPIGPARRALRWVRRRPLPAALGAVAALAVVTAIAFGLRTWQQQQLHRLELRVAHEAEERERFVAGLERVRQRRGNPYTDWSRDTLADLRVLGGLPAAAGHLPDLRSEAAAALAAVDLVPGPLLADFPAYASHFSADSRWLAVAGWEAYDRGRVELTDRRTLARRDLTFPVDATWRAREDRPDGARSVRFSPDGRWLVVGTRSGWLVRWDMDALGAPPLAWPAHTEDLTDPRSVFVKTVGFTTDSRIVLSGSLEAVRGWTVADGRATPLAVKGSRLPLDFYPVGSDGMALKHPDGHFGILQVDQGTFLPHRGFDGWGVNCLGPDPFLMAYHVRGGVGLGVRYTYQASEPRRFQNRADPEPPTHMAFSPAGDLLAVVNDLGHQFRVWDVPGGFLLAERPTDPGTTHVAFSPDGGQLIVSGWHGAKAYDLPSRIADSVLVVAEPEVVSFSAPVDHAAICVVGHATHMGPRVYRTPLSPARPAGMLTVPECLSSRQMHRWNDTAPDGRGFVVSAGDEEKGIQDHSGARLEAPALSDVRYGPDGRLWVLENHHLRLGSMADEAPVVWRNDPANEKAGTDLKCVAPGRQFSLIGRRDGQVFRLDPAGAETASWKVMASAVLGIALSPDEGTAVAGGERGEVRRIDTASGAVTEVPNAHRAAVYSVAHGPTFFATGSADRRVRLWTLAGEPIATLEMAGPVRKVLVSARGDSLLVQVEGERAVRRWRLDVLSREWADLGLAGPVGP